MADDLAYTVAGTQFGLGILDANRRREDEIRRRELELARMKQASQLEQDKIREAFGENAIVGPDGRVDISGSAKARKEIQDKDTLASAQAVADLWKEDPTPEIRGFTPIEPGDPGFSGSIPKQEILNQKKPQVSASVESPKIRSSVDDSPSNFDYPSLDLPNPGDDQVGNWPDQKFIKPVESETPQIQNYQDSVQMDSTEPTPSIPIIAPENVNVRSPRGYTIPTNPAAAAAFMRALPGREADKRMREATAESTRRSDLIQERMLRSAEAQIQSREKITDKTLQSKEKIAELSNDVKREGFLSKEEQTEQTNQTRLEIARIVDSAKAGKVNLSIQDETEIKEVTKDYVIKERIASALDKNISQLTDESIDFYVRKAAGLGILKTLNSAEGKDAVGKEEAERLGQFLQVQFNPAGFFTTGRYFGTDMPSFVKQITLKRDELKARAIEGRAKISEIDRKYSKAVVSPLIESLVKPAWVPSDSWDKANPEQKARLVQMRK